MPATVSAAMRWPRGHSRFGAVKDMVRMPMAPVPGWHGEPDDQTAEKPPGDT